MGRPKAELCAGGVPILQYLLRRLDWPGEKILVTAPTREHPPGHQLFDREVVDPVGGEGPLRGIVTALQNAGDAGAIVVTTCDMPMVTRHMLMALLQALENDARLLGIMMRSGDGIEPFPLALRVTAKDELQARLCRGRRSVGALAELETFQCMTGPSDPAVWTNLNNPDDYQTFLLSDAARG
jgi:molybdopterin-guanine dinucleotide biosynthesis protein A